MAQKQSKVYLMPVEYINHVFTDSTKQDKQLIIAIIRQQFVVFGRLSTKIILYPSQLPSYFT